MASTRQSAVDPEQKKLLETAAQEIVRAAPGHLAEIDGTPTCTVKKSDDSYGRKPILSGSEFALHSVYVGKRGKAIFVFEPVDAQEFAYLEVDQKEIDTVFPTFTPEVAAVLRQDTENMTVLLGHLLSAEQLKASVAKEQAEAELKTGAENHPNFGMFA